jgi:hypothetical protein
VLATSNAKFVLAPEGDVPAEVDEAELQPASSNPAKTVAIIVRRIELDEH